MSRTHSIAKWVYAGVFALWAVAAPVSAEVKGWLEWRGPGQDGVSSEVDLPSDLSPDGDNLRWTYDLAGRGTPVISGNRLYVLGYRGTGPDLQEILACINTSTGKPHWELGFNDFLSDTIYNRYSIGSPAIDPATGKVYILTSPGLVVAVSPDGKILWEHSLMEALGRLTFPNGRTGSPVIDGDLVIVRGITTNWGSHGPARDRFYAFDKTTGKLVWSSEPGVTPQDSSFSTPVFAWSNGQRVFYAGTGCGNVICVNARNGEPVWRFQLAHGGVNSSVLLHGESVIAIHDKENIDSSESGRMVAIQLGAEPGKKDPKPLPRSAESEVWRNGLAAFTSSPVIVGDRLYQVVMTGELCCVDVGSGKVLWQEKLAADQLHASPLYADGKLYVPMTDGSVHVIRPSDGGPERLGKFQLEGECLGAPSVWDGRLYVHTTEKLYCFGAKNRDPRDLQEWPTDKDPAPGEAVALRIVPSELILLPGDRVDFEVRAMDRAGFVDAALAGTTWEKFIPPTAKVKSTLDAEFNDEGVLVVSEDAKRSAGVFQGTLSNLKGNVRGRILQAIPFTEDFESADIDETSAEGTPFAYPPLPWIGARFKWEIHELDGNKVLAKTLDRVLFQRSMTFIGHPDMHNYTIQADVMSDGNRRIMSEGGVINQRYIVVLKGNAQELEVQSNHERVKVAVPFSWDRNTWYTVKARVDVAGDGSGVVRGKAWKRGEPEPKAWTIEVPHKIAHQKGSPGLFGFSPQSKYRVYLDNITVTPND